MMKIRRIILIVSIIILLVSCTHKEKISDINIIFLHHSTGGVIWDGNSSSLISKMASRISGRIAAFLKPQAQLPSLFEKYNEEYNKNYLIEEMIFPKPSPYGWKNYPFDYYNIWVKNAGEDPFLEEPTLELLTTD